MSNDSVFELQSYETVWVEHYDFLLSRGYKLRPRYEPGWIGSWKHDGKDPLMCEDSLSNYLWNVIDAIRLTDHVKVTLKLVTTNTEQVPIALYLSSDAMLSDPRNHTVQVSDFILLPADDEWGLLVMPFLRQFDDPPFEFRGECIELIGQVLEGLEFMHAHNVAHRDACSGNIMMDCQKMIPGGFHHVSQYTHDGIRWGGSNLKWTSRLYSNYQDRTFVTGYVGQEKEVPELSQTVPYDPFKVDIYQLGGVIRDLLQTYHGLRLFRPLSEAMTRTDPTQRPTASEAVLQFRQIVSKLGTREWKARIVPYKDWLPGKILRALCLDKLV